MADKKETQKPKERVKYKFGQHDIDLTNYIHNLGTNVKSYLNSKNWNEGQRQEFMNAYNRYLTGLQEQLANNTNRFTTNDFGSIIDSTGALSNTDNDDIDPVGSEYYYDNKGNRITTDDFNLLGKRKQKKYNTFSANREVATYFNAIGDALKGMETPKEKAQDAFDLSKHGFLADWTTANNPAGGDFNLDPYLEKDAIDETTGKRGTANRAAYLKEQIENYINNIGEYDFSSSPFKDRNTYVSRLRAAAQNLGNGYDSEDVIALNQAGIGNEFLSKFFATEAEEPAVKKTELELQYEQAVKEQAEREKEDQLRAAIKATEEDKYNRERSAYLDNWIKEHKFQRTIDSRVTPTYNYDKTANWIISNHPNIDKEDLEQRRQIMNNFVNFPQLVSFIRGKLKGIDPDTGKDMTLQHIARNLDLAYREGLFNDPRYLIKGEDGTLKNILGDSGFSVIPDSEDYSNYSFIGYNPTTEQYKEFSMLQNQDLSKEINALLRERMAYDAYDRNIQKNEKGGILKFQIGGQGALRHIEQYKKAREAKEARDNRVQENAVKNDRTIEQQEKYENDSKLQWSDADMWRLGAIAGDVASLITSMTGVGSVASAAIGAASTAANQAADMKEGMGFWESLGNNAVSYGLDALSVLPFAKAAKVPRMVKAIAGFTPKLMAGISTIQGLANGEEILKSLKKVKDGESLTVGDWKNISQGLQIVLGGGAAFNRARVANKRLDAARTDSEYVKTNQGIVQLSAKQMKKLRTANTLEEQNKVLKKLGVTLKGKQTGKFWNRKTSDEAVDIPENFVYNLSKPVTLHSGDLQYKYKFGPGEKLLGGVNLDIKFPRVRNVYNKVFHPQASKRKSQSSTPSPTQSPTRNQNNFDELRQLSSQTGKLTPQEINLINRQRAKQKLPALSQQEIDSLNARRAYRGEQKALIDKTFPYVFPTHSWSKKLRLSGIADNARYVQRRKIQEEVRAAQKELAEANLNTPKEKQALANQIADQRVELAVNRNADNVRVQQLRELAAQTLSKQVPLIPKAPLRGKAYINKEKFYDKLFSDDKYYPIRVITQPQKLQLVPKIPRKPSQVQHNSRQKLYDELFGIEPTITESAKGLVGGQPIPKTTKGLARAQRKQEAANQKSAQEYVDKAKRLSKEKEIIKKINWEQTKRELPHKQSSKKKKTSRDDKRTIKREDGGTLDLVRVRKFKNAGKFATLTDPAVTSVIKPFQESSDNKLFFSNINPTIAYGLPRMVYEDRMNRKNTDLAKESVVPLLQKPFYVHRYTRSDLNAEMQGERNYANFKRLARIPITSDGNLQTAIQLQAEVQGQEARTAGKEKSNQVRRQYDELAWQQEKENAANRYEKEMSNMAQLLDADKTKNAFEQAYLYKKATNLGIFDQQLEYDAKVKQKENKALEDNFAKSDIHNAVIYTPNNYGANLTPNELTVWNKVLSGTEPSSLTSPGEFNSYKLALQKVSRAKNDQLRQYYNVPYTRWYGSTPSTPWTPTMSKARSAKNGAKIAVAGIKAKTADAERFQKQIKEYLDRNEKAIDRLSKSLQGLIKASTIK